LEGIGARDGDRIADWGATSADYARHRPPYPASLFEKLLSHGVGRAGQRVLDVGTGVGFLALQFARQGCRVTGVDVEPNQIEAARRLAEAERLPVRFLVGRAEEVELPAASFDVISAGQCWLYFDADRMIPQVKRLLHPVGGRLVVCYFSWLPRSDEIARRSEELVLAHNPDWSAAGWAGEIPPVPAWSPGEFRVAAFFWHDEDVPFTRESWRGRIRACRGVGATLSAADVRRFDEEHACLLERIAPEEFTVRHRVSAHVLEPAERRSVDREPGGGAGRGEP
jgi:SAM-dependent methyltransferase